MAVQPLVLFRGFAPAVEAAVYTVPAGLHVVMRRIVAANVTGGSVPISISTGVAGLATRLYALEPIAANRHIDDEHLVPLEPGDVVTAAAAAASIALTITGFSH